MTPYVTISFANRNDNYGGFLAERIQLFIDYYAHFVKRWPDLFEFVIIDYNPPEDKPRLRDAFDWSVLGHVVHCEVAAEVHMAIPGASVRKIQDYIARNIGLRNGSAPFGMVLNQDIFISSSILEEIAKRDLKIEYFYRADRCDFNLDPCKESLGIKKDALAFEKLAEENTFVVHRRHASHYSDISVDVNAQTLVQNGSVPEPGDDHDETTNIIYCDRSRKRVIEDRLLLQGRCTFQNAAQRKELYHGNKYYKVLHLHTNASGDFVIASKQAWERIHGFPEDPRFYMQTDAYGIFQLFAAGFNQAIFMQPHRIYHADHDRSGRAGFVEPSYDNHEAHFCKILRGEVSYCYNDSNWGLSNYPLKFIPPLTSSTHKIAPRPEPEKKAKPMNIKTTQTQYDAVIIGNGSLGVSLAYQLKKKDKNLHVVVIGENNRHHGASTTAGAMINVWAELTHGQFSYPALMERAGIGINAFHMWDPLAAELSEYSAERVKINWGTYIINNAMSSITEERTLSYAVESMKRFSIPHTVCNPADVPWYKPEGKARSTRMVHIPDGYFDPYKVLAAYDSALIALGVEVLNDEAATLTLGANGDTHSVTLKSGGTISGKQIVLANGSFAQNLIDPVPELRKATPRLLWGGGSAVDVQFPDWVMRGGGLDNAIFGMDKVIRTVDRGGACGVHMVPHGNGRFYLGASSGVWMNPEWQPRVHAIHVLLRALTEEINTAFFYATMSLRGPGFRPTTIDTFPLLGESHVKGVWFANGTKRDGFTCSPFIATEMAKAMAGEANQIPKRFQPSRPLISYKDKATAMEDAAIAGYGGEVQHGLVLPPYAVRSYQQAKRRDIERIYEKRGITDFGIHPEVTHCYEDDHQYALINHPREKSI